ncbi:MAG TPA: transglutaminase-like domain-containing protein [Candidatus Cybelea sp.]|nr:transglutaminase-like domain-containing protein [Candidatus Cybelea sp.]
MTGRTTIEAALAAIGKAGDDAIDIAGTALLLAALDRPGRSLDAYRSHLGELGKAVASSCGAASDAAAQIAGLTDAIHRRFGYGGDQDTYDDMANANLMDVIDRRKGLPVALGILYLHAARAAGLKMMGLNFPGNFLLRLDVGNARLVLDPFRNGEVMDPSELRGLLKRVAGPDAELEPDHYRPVSARDVLLRLQNNIKTRAIAAKNPDRAAEVLRSMLLIAPGNAAAWRELGVVETHRGNLQSALDAFQSCLAMAPDEASRREAAGLVARLKQRLN